MNNKGIPEGIFEIKEDKCEAIYTYVRKEGFEYRLDYFGKVTYKNGWVAYNGYLKPPYDDKPCFSVKIYKKFDAQILDWSHYKFTTYEEALQAPPEVVQYLNFVNPNFEEMPDKLFSFTNLKELVIACKYPLQTLPLKSLPKKIGTLQLLEQITVNGTQVETLPESIGELRKLTRFYFNNGQLKTIPTSLFQLPKLEYLMLSNHRLATLPQHVNLPALKSLDLSGNRLTTIPAILLRQTKLNSIDLEKNPWESLPVEINKIKNVKLSIEDKKRLMDFDYKGADGKGIQKWDDTLFFAKGDAEQKSQIQAIFKANNITAYKDALLALVKKSIAFRLTEKEDYATIANHRFGGMPDLPGNISYPKFIEKTDDGDKEYLYEFIAQINCEEISALQDYLPRKGMLFFFLETIHNIYNRSANNPCKIIYVEDLTSLMSGNRFKFSTDDYFEAYNPAYYSSKVDVLKEISFPSFYASYANQYLFKDEALPLKDKEVFDDGFDKLAEEGTNKKEYQHSMNCYGFTQHESPELQASLKLKGNPEDWIILLKVSSSGDFQWGDAGDLFFIIHKSDLVKCDFSNVFVTLESS